MGTQAIRALVQRECQAKANVFGPAFFEQHVTPVAMYAGELARRLGADETTVELAAYLHDLSAVRDPATLPTHALDSARIACEILTQHGYPPHVVDAVRSSIERHSTPVVFGQGSIEEICLSNADVMSHIGRPVYWLFYQYRVRGVSYEDGASWLRGRTLTVWSGLVDEAKDIIAPDRELTLELLRNAGAFLD